MIFEVYHAIEPTFGMSKKVFPDDYQYVARVDSKSLDDVFHITNHIDHDWTENREVLEFIGSVRSTSVGDVVVGEDGVKWLCAPVGWEKIE